MEEERHYNEIVMSGGNIRNRTVSSPVPYNPSPSSSRPLSPGNHNKHNKNEINLSFLYILLLLIFIYHYAIFIICICLYINIYLLIYIIFIGSSTREGFNTNRCYACGQPTTIPFASSSPPSTVSYIYFK